MIPNIPSGMLDIPVGAYIQARHPFGNPIIRVACICTRDEIRVDADIASSRCGACNWLLPLSLPVTNHRLSCRTKISYMSKRHLYIVSACVYKLIHIYIYTVLANANYEFLLVNNIPT
jgi:hypothetical protein